MDLKADLEKKFLECNSLNNSVMMKDKKIVELERRLKEQTNEL